MVKTTQKSPSELIESLLNNNEMFLNQIPYDTASSHYQYEEYPKDLTQRAVFTYLGMYLGWVIERDFASEALKKNCREDIEKFMRRDLLTGDLFKICCGDEFTKEHLNDDGNAFTRKYYTFMWKYSYAIDYQTISENEISGYYMADTWENYEKVKAMIDSRYTEWLKEQEKEKPGKDKDTKK